MALKTGVSEAIVENVQKEFIAEYFCSLYKKWGKAWTDVIDLCNFLSVDSDKLAAIARKHCADSIYHKATGKDNDRVWFDMSIISFVLEIQVIALWRNWDFTSREQCMDVWVIWKIFQNPLTKFYYNINKVS